MILLLLYTAMYKSGEEGFLQNGGITTDPRIVGLTETSLIRPPYENAGGIPRAIQVSG